MTLSNAEITQDVFKMLKQTSTVSSPHKRAKKFIQTYAQK